MLELLELWEKLEPGRCCFVRSMSVQIWLNEGPQNVHASGRVGRAVIQAAVQEAAEARGWYIGLHSSLSSQGPLYEATVHTGNGYVSCTPAKALLAAYLAVLEAQ